MKLQREKIIKTRLSVEMEPRKLVFLEQVNSGYIIETQKSKLL